jgi:hypothetical protein
LYSARCSSTPRAVTSPGIVLLNRSRTALRFCFSVVDESMRIFVAICRVDWILFSSCKSEARKFSGWILSGSAPNGHHHDLPPPPPRRTGATKVARDYITSRGSTLHARAEFTGQNVSGRSCRRVLVFLSQTLRVRRCVQGVVVAPIMLNRESRSVTQTHLH